MSAGVRRGSRTAQVSRDGTVRGGGRRNGEVDATARTENLGQNELLGELGRGWTIRGWVELNESEQAAE